MEALTNSTVLADAQRSPAAVESVPAAPAPTSRGVVEARPGSAPKPKRSHKKKGRIDRRVQAYRIRAAREAQVVEHLGGPSTVSVLQEALARRWTTLDLRASQMESDAAAGRSFDLAAYIAITDRLHSLSRTLGLERRAQRVPPLAEYMRARTREVPSE